MRCSLSCLPTAPLPRKSANEPLPPAASAGSSCATYAADRYKQTWPPHSRGKKKGLTGVIRLQCHQWEAEVIIGKDRSFPDCAIDHLPSPLLPRYLAGLPVEPPPSFHEDQKQHGCNLWRSVPGKKGEDEWRLGTDHWCRASRSDTENIQQRRQGRARRASDS